MDEAIQSTVTARETGVEGLSETIMNTVIENFAQRIVDQDMEAIRRRYFDWSANYVVPDFLNNSNQFVFEANQAFRWDTTGPTLTVQGVERRRKKYVAKIKNNVSHQDIAKAIAKHSRGKAEKVDQEIQVIAQNIEMQKAIVEMKSRSMMKISNRLKIYAPTISRLGKRKKELLKEFEKMVSQVQKLPQVDSIFLDSRGRIIVNTKPLFVKKDYWDSPREIGQYSIRIDFSHTYFSEGIKVLNITKIYDHYDSPTINNTTCCFGNIQRDIRRDFWTQNLEEIVLDMIDYITSPKEQAGYLGLSGDKTKGWEQWLDNTVARPSGYSWVDWDRQRQDDDEFQDANPSTPISLESLDELDGDRSEIQVLRERNANLEASRDNMRREMEEFRPEIRSAIECEIMFALSIIGIRERRKVYYYRYITEYQGNFSIDSMNLIKHPRNELGFVLGLHSMTNSEERSICVNTGDINSELLENSSIGRVGNVRTVILNHSGRLTIDTGEPIGDTVTQIGVPGYNDFVRADNLSRSGLVSTTPGSGIGNFEMNTVQTQLYGPTQPSPANRISNRVPARMARFVEDALESVTTTPSVLPEYQHYTIGQTTPMSFRATNAGIAPVESEHR